MGQKDEFKLHKNIAEYLRLQYPDAVFLSTLNGIRLPIGQAVQAASLQSGRALPDLILLQARRGYHGLCGEIKTGVSEVYRQDGTLKQDQHIREQADMLALLCECGYHASFWFGFDEAKERIDWYMGL